MSVTSVETDLDSLSLVLIADFDAPLESVWELWSDPRKLERWWGPPSHPATVESHDLSPGGEVTYYMTGPEGNRHHGYWKVTAADPPRTLEFTDGFAKPDGTPNDSMPATRSSVRLSEQDGRTQMELRSRFETLEQLEQLKEMGMEAGLREAAEQMDALLER
jgi:uncharacterized protein YndB with AHSA1/START domain